MAGKVTTSSKRVDDNGAATDTGDDDVFDLDALTRERADGRKPFRFRFGGETFELQPSIDLFAAGGLADGNILDALGRMLGDEQFARLRASGAVFDKEALAAVLDRYSKHLGMTTGKS